MMLSTCLALFTSLTKQYPSINELYVGCCNLWVLSEAFGLNSSYIYEMDCSEQELTMGIAKHTDCDFTTILHQDQIGGLQEL
jgi:hypothetical protein